MIINDHQHYLIITYPIIIYDDYQQLADRFGCRIEWWL